MAKTLRIEITTREEDGRTIVKTLEGEDAAKWSEMIASVCVLAEMHRANPDWGSLNWQKTEGNSRAKNLTPEAEYKLIVEACRNLPPARNNYHVNDFVTNMMATVLDKQMLGISRAK